MKKLFALAALVLCGSIQMACAAPPPTTAPTVPPTATVLPSSTTNPAALEPGLVTPKLVQNCLLQPTDWDIKLQPRADSNVAWVEASMPVELKNLGIKYASKCILETPDKAGAVLLNVFLFDDTGTAAQKFPDVPALYKSMGTVSSQPTSGWGEQGVAGEIVSDTGKKTFYAWRVKNALLLILTDGAPATWTTEYMHGIADKINQRLAP